MYVFVCLFVINQSNDFRNYKIVLNEADQMITKLKSHSLWMSMVAETDIETHIKSIKPL